MWPIFVELADIRMIAVAEFSPNVVCSFTGIEFPLFIRLKKIILALS
jgi:hypothetical protein